MHEHRRMARARPDGARIAAIVLAAGAGSRFGGGKLLAPLEGRPILQHVLERLEAADFDDVVVVVGADADAVEDKIDAGTARLVVNPTPDQGLSSSLKVGIDALTDDVDAALITLGDQPLLPPRAVRALLDAEVVPGRPIVVPVYGDGAGRNPVLVRRDAFALIDQTNGDRGLGPLIDAHPELVHEIPIRVAGGNPDVDTRDDLVALLEKAWAARVVANAEQVERFREVPDGSDFYAPVTGLFRADPRRTDEPVLEALLELVQAGETWLDIGAGAGRYALPIALALAPSGGRVIAVDASPGMLDALMELQAEHGITDVEVVQTRWPPPRALALDRFATDVALIAHVGYDIEAIGPFVRAMESVARRLCVAVLMERQPSSVADPFWPRVHGEERVSLPALPEFIEWLEARGHEPNVELTSREPRRFGSRDELAGFLRRQLWIEPSGESERRFQAALDELVMNDGDGVGLRTQLPLAIGVVTWDPRRSAL
jgi:CTP:molybdopterin cytidylyltransferase MocA/SAM-dependent methyltransferase